MWTLLVTVILLALYVINNTFIIVREREEVIIERLGKYHATLEPGFHFLVPFIDRVAYRQETREQVLDVPHQKCITKDNIEVDVDGLVYLKVMDAYKASYGINDYKLAAVNMAQTTMRSEVGKITLDDTFSERDQMNEAIVRELDVASNPWGMKVLRYEIKDIQPSREITLTMEQQMEAEREKRAEITESSGGARRAHQRVGGRAPQRDLDVGGQPPKAYQRGAGPGQGDGALGHGHGERHRAHRRGHRAARRLPRREDAPDGAVHQRTRHHHRRR